MKYLSDIDYPGKYCRPLSYVNFVKGVRKEMKISNKSVDDILNIH